MASPWTKILVPEPRNLKDIIFEEVAKKNEKCIGGGNFQGEASREKCLDLFSTENTATEGVTAKIIQEYDAHNELSKITKEKHNHASMFLTYDNNHLHQTEELDFESNIDEELDNTNKKDLQHSDVVIAKYDIELIKRKNSSGTTSIVKDSSIYTNDCDVSDSELSKIVCHRVALKELPFIREDCTLAPKLKDLELKINEYELAYNQVIAIMKIFYQKCHLIHANLSPHNIVWLEKMCYCTDISNSVQPLSVDAFHLLFENCEKITVYFARQGIENIRTPRSLFMEITGFDYYNRVVMEERIVSFEAKYGKRLNKKARRRIGKKL